MKEFSQAARKLVDINHWGMDAYCEPARIAEQLAEAMALGAQATLKCVAFEVIAEGDYSFRSANREKIAAEAERLLDKGRD